MRAVLLLALAGCNFRLSGSAPEGDGGVDARRDAGDATVDDVPLDMPMMAGDADGDTVPDDEDNCPDVANVDQRDHDGDTFGDPCDGCPHIETLANVDDDGDDVGNECDPRDNQTDARVLFEGFYDQDAIATWIGAGQWSVSGGKLVQTLGSGAVGIAPDITVNRAYVATAVTIDSTVGNGDEIGLSSGRVEMVQNYDCVLRLFGPGDAVHARGDWIGGGPVDQTQDWPGTFAQGSAFVIVQDLSDDNACSFSQGGQQASRSASRGSPVGRAFLGMSGLQASFDYLFIVDSNP